MRTPAVSRPGAGGPGAIPTRPIGAEFRVVGWLCRHPLIALAALVIGFAVYRFGAPAVGITIGALLVLLAVWWRAHPPSYDRWAAPRVRTCWRRWIGYRGGRWARLSTACELTREHRHSGKALVPRVMRVRAVTPSIDTLRVRMLPGQDLRVWVERLPALADAFGAHQIAATRHRPGVLALVVERCMPFTYTIPATPIPELAADVDLMAVAIGEDEYGRPFLLRIRGKHFLGVGATGAGKSGLMWNPLRAVGPMIRDGLLRVWMIDLKGGMETATARPLFHRWATTGEDAVALLTAFRDNMLARQAELRERGARKSQITPTPLRAAGHRRAGDGYRLRRPLARPRGAAPARGDHDPGPLHRLHGDGVRAGTLQGRRRGPRPVHHGVCLGVTTAVHVDMALGDGARTRAPWPTRSPATQSTPGSGSPSPPDRACRFACAQDWSPTPTSPNSCAPAPPAPIGAPPTAARAVPAGQLTWSLSRARATPSRPGRSLRHEHPRPHRRTHAGSQHDHRRTRGALRTGLRRERHPRPGRGCHRRLARFLRARTGCRRVAVHDALGAGARRGPGRRPHRGRMAG